MLSRRLTRLCAPFLLISCISTAAATETEIVRSEVEIYGHVKLLLRISESEKFGVKVYEGEEDVCKVDEAGSEKSVGELLSKHGHLYDAESGSSKFRIDVDFFGGYDKKKHCLISYEVYLTENFSSKGPLVDLVEEKYDYEDSNPLVKVNGIIHAEEVDLKAVFKEEIRSATAELLEAIHEIQAQIAKKSLPKN